MKKLDTELSMMDTENQILKERCDEYEKRLRLLEGPKFRHMQLLRSMEEFKMPMLAENRNPANYKEFYYVIPKEALYSATDEAIERGLLTSISIGTKKNIRCLTSIKVQFNNGRKDYESPWFGRHDAFKTSDLDKKVTHITACHFQDCTCFLMVNED